MKISEKKALEAYPSTDRDPNGIFVQVRREDCVKGYDQAMQDFLEKACEWLIKHNRGQLVTQFKNYMQDEM